MSLTTHPGAILCVALIAAGQVLFKVVAETLHATGSLLNARVIAVGGAALAIYGLATVFWILLLQTAPLGRLYPYMALSFVLVALASWMFFREAVSPGHVAGLGLIVAGLLAIAVSGPR
jgi:multidrug transporter EmrE-like cation transporter